MVLDRLEASVLVRRVVLIGTVLDRLHGARPGSGARRDSGAGGDNGTGRSGNTRHIARSSGAL